MRIIVLYDDSEGGTLHPPENLRDIARILIPGCRVRELPFDFR